MRDKGLDYEVARIIEIDNADPGQGLFAAALVVGLATLLVIGTLCVAGYVMVTGSL